MQRSQEIDVWKLLQWHVSIRVSNEEALGVELTTDVDQAA